MTISKKNGVLHVALQSALGTAATITIGTTPALRIVGDIGIEQIGEGQILRSDVSSSLGGPVAPRLGSLGWRFTFQTELYAPAMKADFSTTPLYPLFASSAPYTNTDDNPDTATWEPFLGPAAVASGSLPAAGSRGVVTVQFDEPGGNRYRLYDGSTACTGWSADAGGRILLDWTVEGKWVAPAASTLTAGAEVYNPGGAYDLTPWLFCGATLTSGITGTVTGLSSFTYAPGQELVTRMSAGSDGASCMAISFIDRSSDGPTLGLTIDAEDETTLAAWAEWLGGTTEDRSITIPAPSTASIASVTIMVRDAYVSDAPAMGGDAYRTYDLVLRGTTDAGEQPTIITFTGAAE